jgi:hypothetical protein
MCAFYLMVLIVCCIIQVQAWDARELGLQIACGQQESAGSPTSNSCICWVCCADNLAQTRALRQDNGKPRGLFEVTIGTTGKRSGDLYFND